MPLARRHKWVGKWLRQIYKEVLEGDISDQSLELFYQNYSRVLSWLDDSLPPFAPPPGRQWWIEFLSDHFHKHQKKTGQGVSEHDFLPRVIQGDRTSEEPWSPRFHYKVALDNFRSAFNVGSIFRVCDAVGFESVIVGGKTPGASHQQVQKTSMGSSAWIPEETEENLEQRLKRAQIEGYRIIGVETVEGARDYFDFEWPEQGVIVLGNEEYGISESVMRCCDDFIQIPMYGRKNSINVANAFSVIAYHTCFQLTTNR